MLAGTLQTDGPYSAFHRVYDSTLDSDGRSLTLDSTRNCIDSDRGSPYLVKELF